MTQNKIRFSQSMLEDWLACRQRFYLRYLVRMEWPDLQTDQFVEQRRRTQKGVLFHQMMQQVAKDISAEHINAQDLDPDMRRWWTNFTQAAPFNASGATLYPEVTLSAGLGEHLFIAKCDLIVVLPDGRIQIWDWKTTEKMPQRERMARHTQTRLYRLLAHLASPSLTGGQLVAPENIEMIYWFPNFPTQALHFPYSADDVARDQTYFVDLAQQITAAAAPEFFPLTSNLGVCKFCQYRSLCDRGAVGGSLDEYDELECGEIADVAPLSLDSVEEVEL